MSATKILWGQILTVFLIVLMTTWGATQWTAYRFGFQPQLGQPWFELAGWPIYYPPAFFWWWYFYDAYAPPIFVEGAYIAASGGFISIAVAIGMSVWRAREAKNVETYGSARWARPDELKAAGLLGPDGVVLGKHERDYLRHDGPEHVLCFAPTRSGKGVGLVVPSLLTWPGSAIVHDIKGENWTLTAGYRARHGRVLLFDPTNAKSAAYNPLLEVRRGEWEVRDVQNIADILVDPEGSLEKRNHWEKTSHALLVGAILHVLYAEADKTRKELVEAKNQAESLIHTTKKSLEEHGDKVDGSTVEAIELAVGALEDTIKSDDAGKIKGGIQNLMDASMKLGEAIYKAQAAEADGAGEDGPRSVDDDIVDADFEDLGEDKRK
jgi:type IV secretion system protein VirD4